MRFSIVFVLTALLISCAMTEEDERVTRAIKEATKYHENLIYQNTIRGAQTIVKHRGGPKSNPLTEIISKISNINIKALEILIEKEKMERNEAVGALSRQTLPAACQQPQLNCDFDSKYRTADGTCNNINYPLWGSTDQPLNRIVASEYADGSNIPRGGRSDSTLPNPRLVSRTIHPDLILPNRIATHMVPQFGQLLAHDMTFTPENGRQCCSGQQDVDCWPISIPANDPFYSTVSAKPTCLDFTRSTAFCFQSTSGCREQMNINTAYIDGSQIYGSTHTRIQQLRTLSQGRLKTHSTLIGFLPEPSAIDPSLAQIGAFITGDDRVNIQPGLVALQNLFLMEHNRIADLIHSSRPDFTDEQIFQETRRIIIAELQQITYNEYLPEVLGPSRMESYNLNLGIAYSTYDPTVDARIINSFSTAAYRFGHTLVDGLIRLVKNRNLVGTFQLRDSYGQSGQFTQSNGQGYEWILGGLMTQNSQVNDPFVTADLTNYLLKPGNSDFGSDVVARNIHGYEIGRDHGLPGYNTYRHLCGLPKITSFTNRPAEINPNTWNKLHSLYATPDDIDIFTGGLIENPVRNGLSGPTFTCIIAIQFSRSKFGDRFFFTHGGQVNTFNTTQIRQLRSRTLSDIICDNTKINPVLKNVFQVPSANNPWVDCNDATRTKLDMTIFE